MEGNNRLEETHTQTHTSYPKSTADLCRDNQNDRGAQTTSSGSRVSPLAKGLRALRDRASRICPHRSIDRSIVRHRGFTLLSLTDV